MTQAFEKDGVADDLVFESLSILCDLDHRHVHELATMATPEFG